MEEFRVDVRIADGPHAQTLPMQLERFTLIGATTRFGLLTPPLRARFDSSSACTTIRPTISSRSSTRSPGSSRRHGCGRRRGDRAPQPRHARVATGC